jgi:predicted acylesterase/phospholipase RssA
MARFRILSLDGGGIKGVFTASVLAHLEELSGKRIADHFDLITGTSTGGIIALGLGLGVPPRRILDFYVERCSEIFPTTGADRVLHGLLHAVRHKYSQHALASALADILGSRKLGESSCRLVIPTFDCNAGRVQLFKTAHQARFGRDHRTRALDVAMATAAAPTYFPSFTAPDGQVFLDGGIWASCPVLVGLLEAVFVLNLPPADVEVLSVGTTDSPFDVSKKRRAGGLLSWNRHLVTLLMQAQTDGALAQARLMAGQRVRRIDATTRPGRFTLDDAGQVEELRGLGACAAREHLDAVADAFLDTPAAPFRPFQLHDAPAEVREALPRRKVARRRRRRSLGIAQAGAQHCHRIVDISVSGALLETKGEIAVGTPIDLDLCLEDGATARVAARVVRLQHPGWGRPGGVGVQFTGFAEGARAAIEGYVSAGPAGRLDIN